MRKLSLDDIEKQIIQEYYYVTPTKKTTICVLVLQNQFEVIGKSGVVDPKNYDRAIGEKIARERALDQIWLLEGYMLQEYLYGERFKDRTYKIIS